MEEQLSLPRPSLLLPVSRRRHGQFFEFLLFTTTLLTPSHGCCRRRPLLLLTGLLPGALTQARPLRRGGPPDGSFMCSLGDTQRKYWVYLCKCMGYHLHGDINHFDPYTQPMFEVDVLGTLTPKSLERWMNLAAFGVPDPAMGMASMNGRSSSVEFMKKAVSSFMPNKLQGWNVLPA